MTEPAEQRPAPAIPLLIFAAIDLALALFLLADGGFTLHFGVVFVIGLALALLGYLALRKNVLPE
jgi:hypothetical protein